MRYIISGILLLCTIALHAQKQEPLNEQPTNEFVHNTEDATYKFYAYRLPQTPKYDNTLDYHWFKDNELHKTKGGSDGKLLHGSYKVFYRNDQLKEQGEYKEGLKHGEWKAWFPSGELKQIVNYKNGVMDGSFQTYSELTQPLLEANYRNGLLHGETVSYRNGKELNRKQYKNGEEVVETPKPEPIKETKPAKPEVSPADGPEEKVEKEEAKPKKGKTKKEKTRSKKEAEPKEEGEGTKAEPEKQ